LERVADVEFGSAVIRMRGAFMQRSGRACGAQYAMKILI
jgi:hypothetical protein